MKKKQIISGIVAVAVMAIASIKLLAAQVGPAGYAETFGAIPNASDWATYFYSGAAADDYDLTALVQTISISDINAPLYNDSQNDPPDLNSYAIWSGVGGYICTRPTQNRCTFLAAKLLNMSGTNATSVRVDYDFSILAQVTEPDYPGQRVFYSLSGTPDSWIPIPELSSSSPLSAKLVAMVNLQQTWAQSNYLYIIWADDNANLMGSDPAYVIDNFEIVITGGTSVAPPVTVDIVSPTNNAFYTSPESVTISAEATSRDGVITNVVFYVDGNKVGEIGQSPFSYNWQNPPAGLHTIYAQAYDDMENSSTSKVVRVVVFDNAGTPVVKILNPTNGFSIEGPISLPVSAFATAPGGISNVKFYANDTLIGEVDSEPYSIAWNTIFGNIALVAVATGSNGLTATSPAVTITVTEPPINTNPPVIIAQDPPSGATVPSLTQVHITFSEPVINVDASDLLINGKPAKEVSGSGAEYIFRFDAPSYGVITISWASNHGITDIGYPSNLPFDSSNAGWSYQLVDLDSPVVIQRIPAAGDLVYGVLNQVTVIFNEPVTGVDASDLLINGVAATNVTGEGTTYIFNFDSPTNQGLIEVSFAANHNIADLAETPNAFNSEGIGAKWAYRLLTYVQQGNDNFADRFEIIGLPATVLGYNGGATTESGEPLGSGGWFRPGSSVWWKWVAPYSGQVTIDTFESGFNTTLGVYTGTNISTLTRVAYNDNATGRTESLVTFNAVQGTEYEIQVCGAPNGFPPTIPTGIIFLNISMPPSISITSPKNNSTIIVGEPTTFSATVSTNIFSIMQVDFYSGSTYIGTALKPPYSIVITNFPAGSNTIYAVVTDVLSQTANSSIKVLSLSYGITIVEPLDGNIYSGSILTISAMTYLKTGSITNIDFYVDDKYIGSDSTSPYSCVWSNMVGGSHRMIAIGYDDGGKSYTSKPVFIGTYYNIVSSLTLWKYLDNGSDQGTAWKEPDFDDSSWSMGLAPMGYGDANGRYPITTNSYGPDENNKYVTTYYRTEFNASNLEEYTYITLNYQRDDGIIIYLNGQEVHRNNISSESVTYQTYASSSIGGSDENATYSIGLDPSLMREGRNVIAAEVHQSDPSSSDLWFYLELRGYPEIIRNQSPQVALTSPTNNSMYVSPNEIELQAEASDEDGSVVKVEFYDNTTLLGEATEPPYTLKWANPSVGWHSIKAAATDDLGARQFSYPISVIIFETANKPLVEILSPINGRVYDNLEGFTNVNISVRASAFNGVSNVVFLSDGVEIGAVLQEPYSLVWSNVPFGLHTLTATVHDMDGNHTVSSPVNITVVEPPVNTEAPRIASVEPLQGETITNLTTIKITFTERVMGIEASDLLVNGAPALSMTGSGSNYVFTIKQPDYGTVTISWAENHGITDKGYPNNLPFDATAQGATWTYNLIDKVVPYIVSRTPAPNANVSNLTQISITFSEKMSGVDASDLLINGVPAASVSTTDDITYIFAFPRPLYGAVYVAWAQDHNITDRAVAPNAFVPTGNAASWQYLIVAPVITLVPRDAYYLIQKGLFEPSTPITQWRLSSFDDALWVTNQAPFYFDIDKTPVAFTGNTLLDDMYGRYQAIYLRHKFFVPSPQSMTNLTLRSRCDDGYIAYINGVEVFRSSTVSAGDIPFNYGSNIVTSATESSSGIAWITNTISVPSSVLVTGTNILAIQAMNSAASNSDFLMDIEVYASAVDPLLIPPMIASVYPTPGDLWSLTNIVIQFTEPVTGVDANDLLINGINPTDVTQLDSTTYSFSFPQPQYGIVNVSWAADTGIADIDTQPFDGASFQYRLFNAQLPHVVAVYPPPGFVTNFLSQITVEFDCEITNINAGNLLINGTPATSINGEYSSFTFSFAQPAYGKVQISWAPNTAIMNRSNMALVFNPEEPGNSWEYLLLDMIPPTIISQSPVAGSFVSTINFVVVKFSEPVTGVTVGDLLVNGIPSTSILGSGAQYRFGFPTVNSTNIVVTWSPNHGIYDLALIPNLFDTNAPGSTWSYATEDRVAPVVTRISPAAGSTIKSLDDIKIWFSEPVSGVDSSDLTINGITAATVDGSGSGPYTFTFSSIPTGVVVVAWSDNHNIRDISTKANPFSGKSWSYVINPDLLRYVIHISIDGCGALYLKDYIAKAPEQYTNFVRLTKDGAWTLNARCDYFISVTLPNHSSMFTSLPTTRPEGWDAYSYHGLTIDMDNGSTIHSASTGNPNLPYKNSVFDVVHDNGLSTAFLYSKASLTLFARSWSGTNGAPDVVGDDNGRSKIDYILSSAGNASTGSSLPLVEEFERRVGSNTLWNYTFMHFTEPDTVGHSSGWGSTSWSNTIRTIDGYVGRVMNAIMNSPVYSNQTVLIITADHGGTGMGHSDATLALDYTIPLFMWGAKIPAGVDLYSLFANRIDPGTKRVSYTDAYQPLRDGDVGNLACTLLGLPNISNSRIIPLFGTPPVWLNITKTESGLLINWNLNAKDYQLQYAPYLSPGVEWISIIDGIQTNDTGLYYHFLNDSNGFGVFRLIKAD